MNNDFGIYNSFDYHSNFFDASTLFFLIIPGMSENNKVPAKTIAVPIQCTIVNGLSKYQMENNSDKNLRSVTTRVTVRLAHSLVSL